MNSPEVVANTAAYALAYPQVDARTRGRLKVPAENVSGLSLSRRSSRVDTDQEDVFGGTIKPSSSSDPSNLPIIRESQPQPLLNGWFGALVSHTAQCTSLYLMRALKTTTSQAGLSLVMVQCSIVLVITGLMTYSGFDHTLAWLILSDKAQDSKLHSDNKHSPVKRLFKAKATPASSRERSPTRVNLRSTSRDKLSILANGTWLALEHVFLFYSITQLSVLRVVILTSCSSAWSHLLSTLVQILITQSSSAVEPHIPHRYIANTPGGGLVGLCMLTACFAIDYHINSVAQPDQLALGYLSLLGVLLSRGYQVLNVEQLARQRDRFQRSTVTVAALVGVIFGLLGFVSTPSMMPYSHFTHLVSLILPFTALYSVLTFLRAVLTTNLKNPFQPIADVSVLGSMLIAILSCELVGSLAFSTSWASLSDILIGITSYMGISHIVLSQTQAASVSTEDDVNRRNSTHFYDRLSIAIRRTKSVIKTILGNPESRNIYFFLCLNLAYMLVQMMYGVWTNSLGLISDSIHMFFDCMALAMGLFASVMATWPADAQFTYGYGRVETLSGFANGIFLMLISIFIVVEAIQRLVDPPEMNTNKLLVVSFIGLMVNLVGMFATGHHHHHHHGHSHGHGDHDHDHGHSHNMKGVFLHVMADTLGSVGVIISTLLIERYKWTGFDPIASIFIAVLIFASVVPLVQDSAKVLLLDLGEERELEVRKALGRLATVEGLTSYSAPKFWPKDPATLSGSIHIQMTPTSKSNIEDRRYDRIEKIKERVEEILYSGIEGLNELTIQLEGNDGIRNCFCLTRN